MPKPKPLPDCCREHIASYINIDPKEYPCVGAALCCAGCKARLTYTGGTWHREGLEDVAVVPEHVVQGLTRAMKKGGLLDVADH